jgi:hypothetical protein
VVSKYKYRLKCSQCNYVARSNNKGEALSLLRKHLWKKHEAWMIKRIKGGLKKRKHVTTSNPHLQQALLAGIFPPANIPAVITQYKAMSPNERNLVKQVVTWLTVPIGGEASAIATVTMRALDMAVQN